MSLGEWLATEGFSPNVVGHFVVPLVSCVWSSGHETALQYPAAYLFRFLDHHGMLQVTGSPQWYTVVGGSRSYVDRIRATLPDVRTGSPVTSIRRGSEVEVATAKAGVEAFDAVVVATHPEQALAMLADPTDAERDVLGALTYSRNRTLLHRDDGVLPRAREARASWNYRSPSCRPTDRKPVVSYWMNRLQGHDPAQPLLVTLNDADRVDPSSVIARMDYAHPQYTPASRLAQQRLPELATAQTVYAGAYHGWGFHEDGCRSGVMAAEHLGVTW